MDAFKAAMPAFLVSVLRHVLVLVAVKFGIVASEAEIGEAAVWLATGITILLAAAWSTWGRKPKAPPPALIIFGVGLALMAGQMGGCAAKPGTSVQFKDDPTILDPSGTHSVHVLGFDRDTTVSGPLGSETSKLTDEGMQETNSGSALKQRLSVVVLPDGSVRALGSAASDLDIGEVTVAFTDGKPASVTFKNVKTNNTSVQNAVNDGIQRLVVQWTKASDNEKEVLIKQLETQAKMGDVASSVALSIIKAVVGVP